MSKYINADKLNDVPCLIIKNDIVIAVGSQFLEFSGYPMDILLFKPVSEILMKLLMATCYVNNSIQINDIVECFVFTKDYEAREVTISIQDTQNPDEKIYCFIEKNNSRLDQKFPVAEAFFSQSTEGVAIYCVNPEIILLRANQTYLNFFNKPFNCKENSIGRPIYGFIAGWIGSPSQKIWEDILSTGKPFYIDEYAYYGFERGVTYWHGRLIPLFENDVLKYVVEITSDITDRVKNEKTILEQAEIIQKKNKQLEAIIEGVDEYLNVIDKDGNLIKINQIAKEDCPGIDSIYKYINNGVVLYDLDDKILPNTELSGLKIMRGERVKDRKIKVVKDGKVRYINSTGIPIVNENNEYEMGITITHDITDIITNTKVIEEQKKYLEAIIENMNDALLVFDKDGKYIILNKCARERFLPMFPHLDKIGDGRRSSEYYDMDGKLISQEDAPSCRVARGEKLEGFRFSIKTASGIIYQSFNGTPIYDNNGNFIAGLICCQDITEKIKNENLIRAQQELILKSEKAKNKALKNSIKMKDEFLATITHEFKTPLTVINAALQIIDSFYGSQLSDNIKKHMHRIRLNSYRQLRLVNNLLDITKFNSGHLKIQKKNIDIVFLSRAITQSIDLYAKQRGIELKFNSDIEYKEIAIDEEKFERILLNLLSNAIKFTPKDKSVYVNVTCKKREVLIKVIDEGIGIHKSKQELIFERFGQVDSSLSRQAEGTGIGLSLVKTLVTGMGGTIFVDSTVNKGSTFTVSFPTRKTRQKNADTNTLNSQDSRIMQAAAIEFSDMYLD